MVKKNRRRNSYGSGASSHEAQELLLFAENDSELMAPTNRYGTPTQGEMIRRNLARKKLQGKYSSTAAPKAWGYLADSAARKYAWDNYDQPRARHWDSQAMPRYFSAPVRREVAKILAAQWDAEMKTMSKTELADAAGLAASSKYRKNAGARRRTWRIR